MRGSLVLYALFWLVRINGCIRRGRQPLLRGREWFFDVHVPPDFYDGAGRRLLHHYWMRMMMPFAVDIPIATWIIMSGRFVWLNGLVAVLGVFIHINHLISVDLAERQARKFALDEPVAAVMLSLTPRRLRQYVNWKLELALIVTTVSALIWGREHWKPLAILLYLHVGLVYVKHLIVAWRRPVPREQAEEHMAVQEAKRKYYLATLDWWRGVLTMQVLVWPAPFVVWFVFAIVATIVVEIKRKQLARLALRARPVIMPDLLDQAKIARWPLCYAPSAPLLMLKGARGYSINLANTCAVIGLAYVAGFMVLGHAL
ncbi:MAG TPA: hypothetical protein VFA43_13755 [Gemmatimonadaceae bacterium]|nr:hypothetical protein [Gemmatimonadaceae bacterium]